MGQNKNIRWYLKHEEELREQYGAETLVLISNQKVVGSGFKSIELAYNYAIKNGFTEGEFIVMYIKNNPTKIETVSLGSAGVYTESNVIANKLFSAIVDMWKQGDYINYQSGKLFIDGAVEFPKDEYDKMMEYLDDNYGEID